jgi:Flp pilus assembly protein CpaB
VTWGDVFGLVWGPGRRRQWRRRVLRRALAMACALVAALGVLAVARAPRGGPSVFVVVATRSLGAGDELTPASLQQVQWPADLAPAGAMESAATLVGRHLTSSLGAGEVVTQARVSGAGLLRGQPAGTRAVHVTVGDPGAAGLVTTGDAVDLVAPEGTVARDVRVLAVDPSAGASGGLMGGSTGGDGSSGIVVAVDEAQALAIARTPADAMGRPALTLVLTAG